jgi:hypothetical protein
MNTYFSCVGCRLACTQTLINLMLMPASNSAIVKYGDVCSCQRLNALFVFGLLHHFSKDEGREQKRKVC